MKGREHAESGPRAHMSWCVKEDVGEKIDVWRFVDHWLMLGFLSTRSLRTWWWVCRPEMEQFPEITIYTKMILFNDLLSFSFSFSFFEFSKVSFLFSIQFFKFDLFFWKLEI